MKCNSTEFGIVMKKGQELSRNAIVGLILLIAFFIVVYLIFKNLVPGVK